MEISKLYSGATKALSIAHIQTALSLEEKSPDPNSPGCPR